MSKKTITSKPDFLRKVSSFLCDQLEHKHVKYLLIYFAVISIFELAAYKTEHKIFTITASRIWLLGCIICCICIFYYFVKAVKSDITQKNILSLIGLFGVIFYLLYLCGNVDLTDINPDATQQVAAGLNSFLSSDLNYTGKAFLGYPNRQYILAALPALFLGRSITTLQLGFGIPFILGIMTLYGGLRQWTDRKGMKGSYVIVAILSLFAFRFMTEYYINFEQAILPVSLTMIAIGLYLNLLCKPNMISIVSIAWIGGLCSNSYTPVLATLCLLVIFIALYSFALLFHPEKLPFSAEHPKETAKVLISADAVILIFLFATLLAKRSDRITEVREDIKLLSFAWKSIYEFLTDKNAVFFGCMGILIFIYLILSLFMQLKFHNLLLAIWVLGVFVASNLLVGYTSYSPAWIMQRALIVIPVLVTGISLVLLEFLQTHKLGGNQKNLAALMLVFIIIGKYHFGQVNQSFQYFHYIQPMKYMLSDLEATTKVQGISHMDHFNFVLYTDNIFMQNPADYFKFLYPNASVYIGEYGSFPDDVNLSLPTIIYGENDIDGMTPSGYYQMVKYENKRYQQSGIWYKISIVE